MSAYLDKRWKKLPELPEGVNLCLSEYVPYASFHAKDGALWFVYRGVTSDGWFFLVKSRVKSLDRKRYNDTKNRLI